ncbi:MAG: alpha/beta hydrolase, partial [Anaerolineae bacterium]
SDALSKSAQSFSGFNLALELQKLTSPTLLLHGEDDPLLPPPSDDLLRQINRGKAKGAFLPFIEPNLKHFPMLEITAKFNRLLIDFLEAQDLANVQFKDQWRRTMR